MCPAFVQHHIVSAFPWGNPELESPVEAPLLNPTAALCSQGHAATCCIPTFLLVIKKTASGSIMGLRELKTSTHMEKYSQAEAL